MTLKRGSRVEWTDDNGNTLYGTVHKGGGRQVIVIHDGGLQQSSGHPSLFKPSSQPIPTDTVKTPMDRYSVVGYKEQAGHDDSQAFAAYIAKDGEKILRAVNTGHGGEVEYYPVRKNAHQWDSPELQTFQEDARAWEQTFNPASTGYGAGDCWIEWYVYERPYGVTAQAYWQKFVEMLTET